MKKILSGAMMLALVAGASTVEAQQARPLSFGVAGGLSLPVQETGDVYKMGYHVQGMLGMQPATLPVGLRFDVHYGAFDGDANTTVSFNSLGATANAILSLGTQAPGAVSPYLIGGAGVYRTTFEQRAFGSTPAGTDAQTKLGLNGGAGIRFGLAGMSTFVEGRYHSAFTEGGTRTTMVPIVFGIMF